MAKQLLLLGGTSFFGKEIARLYAKAGYEVTIFTRGNATPADLPPHRHVKGDRHDAAALKQVGREQRWDVIVDNIAFTGADVQLAVDAFSEAGRYLLCSTVSVYRFVRERFAQPLREDMVDYGWRPPQENPKDVHWSYARGKLEAEKVLIDKARMPWTILRPPVVYGPFDPTDRGFWYVARLLDGGPVLLADSGNFSFRIAYSNDVARAFFDVLATPRTIGRAYNTVQREVITLRQFVDESARALKVAPTLVDVPSAKLGDLGGPYAAPIMVNFVPDDAAARADFAFHQTPFTEWVASSALWFRDQWKGDRAKLLATRDAERSLAR